VSKKHYSDQILDALVARHGWELSASDAAVMKAINVPAEEDRTADGFRMVYGQFDDDRCRYLVLVDGGIEIFQLNCCNRTMLDVAAEFDVRVGQYASGLVIHRDWLAAMMGAGLSRDSSGYAIGSLVSHANGL
jgi:hypothetical protein